MWGWFVILRNSEDPQLVCDRSDTFLPIEILLGYLCVRIPSESHLLNLSHSQQHSQYTLAPSLLVWQALSRLWVCYRHYSTAHLDVLSVQAEEGHLNQWHCLYPWIIHSLQRFLEHFLCFSWISQCIRSAESLHKERVIFNVFLKKIEWLLGNI